MNIPEKIMNLCDSLCLLGFTTKIDYPAKETGMWFVDVFQQEKPVFWIEWSEKRGFGIDSETAECIYGSAAEFYSRDYSDVIQWIKEKKPNDSTS